MDMNALALEKFGLSSIYTIALCENVEDLIHIYKSKEEELRICYDMTIQELYCEVQDYVLDNLDLRQGVLYETWSKEKAEKRSKVRLLAELHILQMKLVDFPELLN